ncbi:MAG: hypothetical protein VB133_16030 [Anaeromusa sp.]|uniref:hypothetical protein n=1 Tax=Anaeromusa sp. TaxID=1872520 RepID=UPI002B2040F3|nr:hypothetical protein [Anaeromusa sp.]MEA4836615.1 hypothetical protein [Anaeromusa sp.]
MKAELSEAEVRTLLKNTGKRPLEWMCSHGAGEKAIVEGLYQMIGGGSAALQYAFHLGEAAARMEAMMGQLPEVCSSNQLEKIIIKKVPGLGIREAEKITEEICAHLLNVQEESFRYGDYAALGQGAGL